MPDKEVETIEDVIFYQYAKIMVRSALGVENGVDAKRSNYGLIKNRFRALKGGAIKWSDILREDLQMLSADKACAYCKKGENITNDHIIPQSSHLFEVPSLGEHLKGIHNIILACKSCNSSKGKSGLYGFYLRNYDQKSWMDFIPSLLEKKYLKLMWKCHEALGTLQKNDLDGDGDISVLDIDFIINNPLEEPL